MMKADVTRQMVRFMETDLPEKKQIDLTVPQITGERAVLSMDHVVVTGFWNAADLIYGNAEGSLPTDSLLNTDALEFVENPRALDCKWSGVDEEVCVDRARLIMILSALTSEWVHFRIKSFYPMLIKGEIGEVQAAAAIGPRIENE